MKKIIILISAFAVSISSFSQEDTTKITNENAVSEDRGEKTSITISEDEIISVDENNDTTRIKIGNKGISIVETPDGTKIDIHDLDSPQEGEEYDSDHQKRHSKPEKFKGHWSGFQLGLNNYVNSDFSMNLDNSMSYMNLNTGKSWTYSINFIQQSFGFGTDRAGILSGLGMEWSNYQFDGNTSIQEDSAGNITPLPLASLGGVIKNKLQTTYLTVPLLLEFQIPAGKKRLYFTAGLIGGLKLGSHTKVVYKDVGDKKKIRNKDDFSLSPLRYGATARIGYDGLNLFASYYFTQLFEPGKGPELYPFSIGLTLFTF